MNVLLWVVAVVAGLSAFVGGMVAVLLAALLPRNWAIAWITAVAVLAVAAVVALVRTGVVT